MISPKLKQVIIGVLKVDDFDILDATTAKDVPGWDSLSHLGILSAVEKDYHIHFRTMEVLRLKNVGDLQRLVDAKTAK
jgi:acyl carrier protein